MILALNRKPGLFRMVESPHLVLDDLPCYRPCFFRTVYETFVCLLLVHYMGAGLLLHSHLDLPSGPNQPSVHLVGHFVSVAQVSRQNLLGHDPRLRPLLRPSLENHNLTVLGGLEKDLSTRLFLHVLHNRPLDSDQSTVHLLLHVLVLLLVPLVHPIHLEMPPLPDPETVHLHRVLHRVFVLKRHNHPARVFPVLQVQHTNVLHRPAPRKEPRRHRLRGFGREPADEDALPVPLLWLEDVGRRLLQRRAVVQVVGGGVPGEELLKRERPDALCVQAGEDGRALGLVPPQLQHFLERVELFLVDGRVPVDVHELEQ
mmetsp:Transcript_34823/g.81650  ORF Transcript_34823/g.81650 Transcript_34823/m.81650 type:complete len:315 (-) Transcript_34823:642-1586(-)